MRILLDMQGCQSESRLRGIGRYSMALSQAIARNAGVHEIWLLLSDRFPDTIEVIREAFEGLVPQSRITVFQVPVPVAEKNPENAWRSRAAELVREYAVAELNPDLVHINSLFEGFVDDATTSVGCLLANVPTCVTLYDLIPLLNPSAYLANPVYKGYYYRKLESLKRADLLLAISESSGREAQGALGVPPEKISTISAAADERFRPADLTADEAKQILERFGVVRPFVMYTGILEPRKNVDGLLRAFARLPASVRSAHQLLLVCQVKDHERPEFIRRIGAAGLAETEVVVAGSVTDQDLVYLYSLCRLFVFPSLHEGFGLPALEAMACGAAVIGSNTSSIPEVIGREDALFDPRRPRDIAAAMLRALTEEEFRESLRAWGSVQSKRFSWDITGRKAIAAFERLLEGCSAPVAGEGGGSDRQARYASLLQAIGGLSGCPTENDVLETAQAIAANERDSARSQLLVDVSELAQRDAKTGIQRVVRSLLKELLATPPPGFVVKPVYTTAGGAGYRYARAFEAQFLGESGSDFTDFPVEVRAGDIFLGLDLQSELVPQQADFFHRVRRSGVEVYFVVYDLLPIQLPRAFPPGAQVCHVRWLAAVAEADGAICISRAIADELKAWLDANGPPRARPFKLGWFHLGADLASSCPTDGVPGDAEEVLRSLSSRPSFLMVGTVEPRKGYAQVLGAFELLWARGVDANLVIVGKQGWMVEKFSAQLRDHEELGKRIFWLEGISDEYLEHVYAACSCLIAASEGEGFGLPLIEAAQHGLPVMARDIPVFREVAGEHAQYFRGAEASELAKVCEKWLESYARGTHPKPQGMPWLTWKQSAERIRAVLLDGEWYATWTGGARRDSVA